MIKKIIGWIVKFLAGKPIKDLKKSYDNLPILPERKLIISFIEGRYILSLILSWTVFLAIPWLFLAIGLDIRDPLTNTLGWIYFPMACLIFILTGFVLKKIEEVVKNDLSDRISAISEAVKAKDGKLEDIEEVLGQWTEVQRLLGDRFYSLDWNEILEELKIAREEEEERLWAKLDKERLSAAADIDVRVEVKIGSN